MELNDLKKSFFGVYLLKSKNIKYNDAIYIGFTVNPERRIKQHNRGKNFGGAWKTSGKGPWDMLMVVHGFPNEIAALRFEWCWQHPNKSRVLRDLPKRRYAKETEFDYRLRILNEMCSIGPWWRLPLRINILSTENSFKIREKIQCLPYHMSIEDGPILENSTNDSDKPSTSFDVNSVQIKCYICKKLFMMHSPILNCNNCKMVSHLICLAKHLLGKCHHIIPIYGTCPSCHIAMNYGDLIKNNLSIF